MEFYHLHNIEEVAEKVSAEAFIMVMDLTKGYFRYCSQKEGKGMRLL